MTASRRFSLYFSTTIAQGISGIVTLLLIIPSLSLREIGFLTGLETISYLFAAVAGLNLDRAMSRLYFDRRDDAARARLAYTLHWVAALSILVLLLLALALRDRLQLFFPEISFWPFIALALARTALDLFTRVQQSLLIASGRAETFALITWGGVIINVMLAITFVLFLDMGLVGFLASQCIGWTVQMLITQRSVYHRLESKTFSKADFKESFEFAWPFMPALIVSWVLSYTDRIFIDRLMSIEDLGVYGLALRFASVFLLFVLALQKAVYPSYYRLAGESGNGLLHFSRAYIYLATSVAVLFTFSFTWFMQLVFGARYELPLQLFGFIVGNYWLSSVGFLTSESIVRAKKTGFSVVIGGVLALLSLCLNFMLVPLWGFYGSIAAMFAAGIAAILLQIAISRRFVAVPMPWISLLWGTLLVMTAAVAIGYANLTVQIVAVILLVAALSRPAIHAYGFLRQH